MVRAPADWKRTLREAEALVRRRDPRALDLLLPALRWRDQTARQRATVLIARLGPTALQRLVRTLKGAETATERGGAAEALGRIGDSRAVAPLIRALSDPNMVVRRFAMVALLRLGALNAVPALIARLTDRTGGVRVLAANVLGKFEDPRAVPGLIRALRDPQWYVRQAAATALASIGDLRTVPALERATRDSRKAVARAAAAALRVLRN